MTAYVAAWVTLILLDAAAAYYTLRRWRHR